MARPVRLPGHSLVTTLAVASLQREAAYYEPHYGPGPVIGTLELARTSALTAPFASARIPVPCGSAGRSPRMNAPERVSAPGILRSHGPGTAHCARRSDLLIRGGNSTVANHSAG
jgi:hypothetical protein